MRAKDCNSTGPRRAVIFVVTAFRLEGSLSAATVSTLDSALPFLHPHAPWTATVMRRLSVRTTGTDLDFWLHSLGRWMLRRWRKPVIRNLAVPRNLIAEMFQTLSFQ